MTENKITYEIETRCHFDSSEEAYATLPFLRACLWREDTFVTRFYGLTLFNLGQLLRVSEVYERGETLNYIGWKGPDIGLFANIRLEVDEETTSGLRESVIMNQLGADKIYETRAEIVRELETMGYSEFMSFKGEQITGYDERYDLKLKLLTCPVLKWPLLVELEKTATSEEEARRCESKLREFCREFRLEERLVREEPPTLLYERVFGNA